MSSVTYNYNLCVAEYALWLIPSPTEYKVFEELMNFRPAHSKVEAGSKSYPRFAPHITLATFADPPPALDMDDLLIYDHGIEPPVMDFMSWKRGDKYLGAITAQFFESDEIIRLQKAIATYLEALGTQWKKSRIFPHMSFFYVDEPQERLRLEKDLKDNQKWFELFGDLDAHSRTAPITQFTGTEIWLVDCTRSVRQWQVMEKRVISFSLEQTLLVVPSKPKEPRLNPQPTPLAAPPHQGPHTAHHKGTQKQATSSKGHSPKAHLAAPITTPATQADSHAPAQHATTHKSNEPHPKTQPKPLSSTPPHKDSSVIHHNEKHKQTVSARGHRHEAHPSASIAPPGPTQADLPAPAPTQHPVYQIYYIPSSTAGGVVRPA